MSILESMCLWAYGDDDAPYTKSVEEKPNEQKPVEDKSTSATTEPAAAQHRPAEDVADLHRELFHNLEDANRHWLDHMQSETALTVKFAGRVATARSFPDAVAVCQEWISLQAELIAKDSQLLFDDTQKVVAAGAHLVSRRPLEWGLAGPNESPAEDRFATIVGRTA